MPCGSRRWGELGHGFIGEVAALGDLPLVVGLDQHKGRKTQQGSGIGEDRHYVGSALNLFVHRSNGLVDHTLR